MVQLSSGQRNKVLIISPKGDWAYRAHPFELRLIMFMLRASPILMPWFIGSKLVRDSCANREPKILRNQERTLIHQIWSRTKVNYNLYDSELRLYALSTTWSVKNHNHFTKTFHCVEELSPRGKRQQATNIQVSFHFSLVILMLFRDSRNGGEEMGRVSFVRLSCLACLYSNIELSKPIV